MHALGLHGIVRHEFIFLCNALLVGQSSLDLEGRELSCDVRQHKQLGVIHLIGKPGRTLVGEVAGVQLLVDDEIQGCHTLGHLAVVVLHVDFLGLQHAGLDAFLGQILDEGLVLRQSLVRAVK